MKLFIAIVAVAIIVSMGVFALQQKTLSVTIPQAQSPAPTSASANNQSSRYLLYSQQTFAANSTKRRVLFFYANWCPTCRPADASFNTNATKIPEDTAVIRVNYNDSDTSEEEKALANKYGITYQHTFVQIDDVGNVITQWNGGDIDQLLKQMK